MSSYLCVYGSYSYRRNFAEMDYGTVRERLDAAVVAMLMRSLEIPSPPGPRWPKMAQAAPGFDPLAAFIRHKATKDILWVAGAALDKAGWAPARS
ncbi:hypothetical protein ACW9UR_05500 [Halovulum sp. GXIMD14794]